MDPILVIILVLVILAFAGGNLGFGGAYRGPGNILGFILLLVLVVLVVRAIL